MDVMHFTRVFPGLVKLAARNNVEYLHATRIDPLAVYPELHDMHLKVDLDGQFMCDGFPLCGDVGFFLLITTTVTMVRRGRMVSAAALKEGTLPGGFFENTGVAVTRWASSSLASIIRHPQLCFLDSTRSNLSCVAR